MNTFFYTFLTLGFFGGIFLLAYLLQDYDEKLAKYEKVQLFRERTIRFLFAWNITSGGTYLLTIIDTSVDTEFTDDVLFYGFFLQFLFFLVSFICLYVYIKLKRSANDDFRANTINNQAFKQKHKLQWEKLKIK